MELSTAVKPFLLRQLFARGHGKVLYLDPDIWVFRPLDDLFAWLDDVRRAADAAPHGAARRRQVPRRARHPAVRHLQPRLPGHRRHRAGGRAAALVVRPLRVPLRLRHHARHVRRPALDGPGARPRRQRADRARSRLQPRLLEPQAPRAVGPARGARSRTAARCASTTGAGSTRRSRPRCRSTRTAIPKIETEPLLAMAREYSAELLAAGYRDQHRLALLPRRPSRTAIPIAKEMRDLFRTHPLGRFPDPFEPAGDDSFVHWAVTPPPAGGPAPLLEQRARAASRASTAARAGSARCPVRVLRKIAVQTLLPLREALRRRAPLAPLASRVLERRRRRAAGVRAPGRRRRPPGVRALAVARRDRPPQAEAGLGGGAGSRRSRTSGVMRALLDFYDGDAELQRRFPQAFVEEHDAGAFLAWLEAHAVARGFPAASLAAGAAAVRLAAARSASGRSTRAGPTCRPPTPTRSPGRPRRASSPGCTCPAARSTACRRTACSGSSARRSSTPACAWTRRGASTRRGGRCFRSRRPCSGAGSSSPGCGRSTGSGCRRGSSVCARPTALRPVDELRLFHREDAEANASGPRAFEDADDTDALLDVVRGARGGARRLRRLDRGGPARAAADGAARGRDDRRLPAHGVRHGRAVALDRARAEGGRLPDHHRTTSTTRRSGSSTSRSRTRTAATRCRTRSCT